MKYSSPAVQAKLDTILAVLADEALTLREIAARSEISLASLKNYLPYLRAERAIYIKHYAQRGAAYAPAYTAGDHDDALLEPSFKPEPLVPRKMFVPRRDWAASWIPTKQQTQHTL
jgi:hypothetical protein